MKVKLNGAYACAYIEGGQSEPLPEIECKHIFYLASCLQEAANRPGINLANLYKTADHHVQDHQHTENRQEFDLLTVARDVIKARSDRMP